MMLITLFLLVIFTIGAVNAAENTTDDVVGIENQNNVVNEVNDDVLADNPKTFADLNSAINGNDDSDVYLNGTYLYHSDSDSSYQSGIKVSRNVTIHGNGCIIDGNNSAVLFVLSKGNIVFKDTVFVNGKHLSYYESGSIYNTAILSVVNCTFMNNVATRGGAIHNEYMLSVENCTFINNTAKSPSGPWHGGAIYSHNKFSAVNSKFINNYAQSSGGAIHSNNGLSVVDCEFINNSARGNGGAVYTFYQLNLDSSAVESSIFINNSAGGDGGAVEFGTLNMGALYKTVDCIFINNSAKNGGALYSVNATNCNFTNNKASQNGGAMYGASVAGSNFENNVAGISGNDTYNTTVKTLSKVIITAPAVTTPYNGGKFLIATLTDGDGKAVGGVGVSVTLNEVVSNLTTNSSGQISLSCDGIDPGDYVAKIKFNGDDTYLPAEKSTDVIVEKVASSLDVVFANIEVGQVAYINVTLNTTATGNVVLAFDKQNYTKAIENGKALFAISDLLAGNQTFKVIYGGDEFYKNSSVTKSIEVKKIDIVDVQLPTSASQKQTTFSFDLPSDASGNVTLEINGDKYNTTVKNGKVNFNLVSLEKGKYPYNVSYSGDDKYNQFTKSGTLNVDDVVTYISITKVSGDCVIEGVLKEIGGKVIKNADLSVKVGDSNLTVKTDDEGTFTLQAKDNTEVIIMFAGKDAFLASNATITLKNIVPVRAVTKIIGENYTQYAVDFFAGERGGFFKVKLTDASGAPLANKTVNIGYNGKCLVLESDNDGFVQVQINLLAANTLTFAVAFLGDDVYDASFEVYKITINKKTTSLSAPAKTYKASAKTKSYTVTLKTIKGSSADGKTYLGSGKTITLSLNGKTYTAKTNDKGQATFKLDIKKKGTFKATVSYAGDNTYAATKTTANIKIN